MSRHFSSARIAPILALIVAVGTVRAIAQGQDASALEMQFRTCAKHYIPADKCTTEVFEQLKAKDEAPLDAKAAAALRAAKEYRSRLKNPDSLQVHTAFVTDKGDVCLEVGGQNGMGGQTVSRVVYTSRGRWLDEGGVFGSWDQANRQTGGVNRWLGVCTKGALRPKLVPGTDVTASVNEALKSGK